MLIPEDRIEEFFGGLESGVTQAVDRASQRTAEIAWALAKLYSQGTLSTAELASMGHPYAKRHGSPLEPPEIVNLQTGAFEAAWKIKAGPIVYNDDPIAPFLQKGTTKMFARPIDKEVLEQVSPLRDDILQEELKGLSK